MESIGWERILSYVSCLMSHVRRPWFSSFVKDQRIILGAIYDVNTFFPIFYKQSRTLNRLIRLNKQLDDKRINFNRDIRVLDLEILIYLSG